MGEGRWVRAGESGQLCEDRWVRAGGLWQVSQGRWVRTGVWAQVCEDMWVRTGKWGQVCEDRCVRTVEWGQVSEDRYVRTGEWGQVGEGRFEGPHAVTDSRPSLPHKPVLSPGGFCLSPPCCLFQATLLLCFRYSLLMVQNQKFESQAPSAVCCILLLRVALVEAFLLIQGVSVEQPRCDLAILVKREASPWTQRTLSVRWARPAWAGTGRESVADSFPVSSLPYFTSAKSYFYIS